MRDRGREFHCVRRQSGMFMVANRMSRKVSATARSGGEGEYALAS